MNKSEFSQRLFAERKRLGHDQHTVAKLLNMTQPAYSRMENGITNPGVKRSEEIIKKLSAHGYCNIPPVQIEEIEDKSTVVIRWPWNATSLMISLAVLALMIVSFVVHHSADFVQGVYEGATGQATSEETGGFVVLPVLLLIGIYVLYRYIKMAKVKQILR